MRGCTQCGECLNVCPVFRQHWREEYAPKGKRLLLEPFAANSGAKTADGLAWDDVFALARLCAGCGRCKLACARKLSTADLLAEVRAAHPHWTQRLWDLWINHMGPLWPTVGFLAALAPAGLTPAMLETSLATARALGNKKDTPPWARLAREREPEDASPVALFSGCTARNVRPHWADKAESLLRLAGYAVADASAFTCCGGTMHHAGRFETMNAMRRTNVDAWKGMGKPRIAAFCASCFHSLEAYAEEFLQGDEAREWKRSLVPLSSLLGGLEAVLLEGKPRTYGYHQPCHWEKDPDMPFLARILPGLAKGDGLCCGMGGILKLTDPDLSARMARTCLDRMPGGAGHILTGCSGCVMQLSAYAGEGITVLHWLDAVVPGTEKSVSASGLARRSRLVPTNPQRR